MGKLLDALSRPSSYRAKQTPIWDEIVDRIAGALLPADLDDFERWRNSHELEIPQGWDNAIDELVDKRRDELAAEDINAIVRDRFDFS